MTSFEHNGPEAILRDTCTDRILLRKASDQSAGQNVYGWAGTWPPPAKLVLIIQRGAIQLSKLIEPDLYPQVEDWQKWGEQENCDVAEFELTTASKMPEPAKPGEHWFRGAEYVVVRRG
jgi:hypothetical protein